MRRLPPLLLAAAAGLLALGACGDDDSSGSAPPTDGAAESTAANSGDPVALRLGYFPNVTHAPALLGIQEGIFEDSLGDQVDLEVSPFNAGPEAIESLLAGAIDATFIGPNPAINAFAQSDGEAIRIVSGTTSGGAFLVVRPDIESAEDLRGETLATPQLGGTQDVALRSWLQDQGLATDTSGGGDVSIAPQANADTLAAFLAGDIAGAWVPEPWATRLIQEGGAKVLVDERDLWPDGRYVTTHLIVSTDYLEQHPDVIQGLIEGLDASITAIETDPEAAKTAANAAIEEATGKPIKQEVIDASWENLTFTLDPIPASLVASADAAAAVGLLDPVDLTGIYDLSILNEVLAASGKPKVEGL